MKPFDVAIVTTSYFAPYRGCDDPLYRLKLFCDEIESVRQLSTDGKRIIWAIFDDGSDYWPNKFEQMHIPVEIHSQLNNIGWARLLPIACTRGCELADWVINMDSDGLIAQDAIRRVFSLVQRYPRATGYGLFNTKYHHTKNIFDDHVIKQSIPEHGIMFRAKDYDVVPRPDNFPLMARLPAEPEGYPVLRPSCIQHTGKMGINSTADDFDIEFSNVT